MGPFINITQLKSILKDKQNKNTLEINKMKQDKEFIWTVFVISAMFEQTFEFYDTLFACGFYWRPIRSVGLLCRGEIVCNGPAEDIVTVSLFVF